MPVQMARITEMMAGPSLQTMYEPEPLPDY